MNTDTQVLQDILREFKNSPLLDYTRLHLQVQDGVVTIAGRVNSLAERKTAERAAKRVSGIRTLILEIGAAAFPTRVTDSSSDARP